MSAAVSATLAAVLRARRGDLNAGFATARVRYPDLDDEAFTAFVRDAVDPLAVAVERVRPESVSEVVQAAYDVALELVGQKLVGGSARAPFVDEAWRRVLPAAASLVAMDATRLIAAVCNAAHHLSATPGARPAVWIETMARLAPRCSDSATLLAVGQVAAWRAGMAHFRRGALAAADGLPESLALAVVDAPSMRWPELRDRLAADPWFDPGTSSGSSPKARVAARAGAFRGFGGLFTEPPTVAMANEQLFVRGGAECWVLEADAFGATFHRATTEEFETARKHPAFPAGVSLQGTMLVLHGERINLGKVVDEVSSACASRTTLALTSPQTHAVLMIALPVA